LFSGNLKRLLLFLKNTFQDVENAFGIPVLKRYKEYTMVVPRLALGETEKKTGFHAFKFPERICMTTISYMLLLYVSEDHDGKPGRGAAGE
jgi:hypothetical protein